MGNSSKRDTKRLDAAARDARVIQLRRDGFTLEQIAKELGFAAKTSPKRIFDKAVAKARSISDEEVRSLIYFEMERLDFDWRQTQYALDKIRERMKVGYDTRAISDLARILSERRKIQERRAAYKGLDAPKRAELGVGGLLDFLATGFPPEDPKVEGGAQAVADVAVLPDAPEPTDGS